MPVVVVTDSSACLPLDLVEQYGIEVVPLHVLVGDHDYRDGVDDIDLDAGPITTSGASPEALREAYSAALARSGGDGVLAVHISRQLSGTWNAARTAVEDFDGSVRIVDSQSAGMGVGFPVLAAARAADGGASLGSAYRHAVEAAAHTSSFFVVDRLDHLRRGGRIGAAAALLGTALAMKPVLHVHDGKLTLKEKTRTSTKALGRLTEIAVSQVGQARVSVAVHHLYARDRADDLVRRLTDRIPTIDEIFVTDFSAVLGAHVGPGAVGVALVSHPGESARSSDSSTGP